MFKIINFKDQYKLNNYIRSVWLDRPKNKYICFKKNNPTSIFKNNIIFSL